MLPIKLPARSIITRILQLAYSALKIEAPEDIPGPERTVHNLTAVSIFGQSVCELIFHLSDSGFKRCIAILVAILQYKVNKNIDLNISICNF